MPDEQELSGSIGPAEDDTQTTPEDTQPAEPEAPTSEPETVPEPTPEDTKPRIKIGFKLVLEREGEEPFEWEKWGSSEDTAEDVRQAIAIEAPGLQQFLTSGEVITALYHKVQVDPHQLKVQAAKEMMEQYEREYKTARRNYLQREGLTEEDIAQGG